MSGAGEIFKKEIVRVVKDQKMLFSVFILPVVVMVGVMYLMGNVVSGMMDDIEKHRSIVYIQNQPDSFREFLKSAESDADVQDIETASGKLNVELKNGAADVKELRKIVEDDILNGKADLLIEFPEGFDDMIKGYKAGDTVPQIKAYYNPSEDYSDAAYNKIAMGMLESYRQTLLAERVGDLSQLAVFTVNSDEEQMKEMIIQDDQKANGKALGVMLPYFVTVLLFAGAMGIGTDMIAGEKERGTMASLLVTPIKRSSIIFGKVFALMTISGVSSVISVVAMAVSMPLMTKAMGSEAENVMMNLEFTTKQIIMLGVLLLALAFLYSSIIALISVFAKTIKEANSYVTPAYMLVLIVGILTMYMSGDPDPAAYYIPIYNSAIVLKGILSQEVTMAQYGITLAVTLGLGLVLTGVIAKAFESEKVMSA